MNKTLRISFALKNTYRVNSILYSLKQIPLVKKLLPDRLYQVRGLKIFANIVSVIWEFISVFGGKFLYFLLMISGAAALYSADETPALFLHIVVVLSMSGAFINTFLFNPGRDKYYALILMRMNAREYALVHYVYKQICAAVGTLPFALFFGLKAGLYWWECVLIPVFIVAVKLIYAAYALKAYERHGKAFNENKGGKGYWLAVALFLAAAYGLPAAGVIFPRMLCTALMLISIVPGLFCIKIVAGFKYYKEVYRIILNQSMSQMQNVTVAVQNQSRKVISADTGISSNKKGFEYLNELFIRRHQKILWRASKQIAAVSAMVFMGILLLLYLKPQGREVINALLLVWLPYFVFIMYAINRGTSFTMALFMNCDHSLLTYPFYKKPQFVLKLFKIRLREIIKVNLLPALMIGGGLTLLLYVSGGTDNPLNYVILFVSIICMSIFFSMHYLTIYYLLQPYNAGTELKGGMYRIVTSATYFICFIFMQMRIPILIFGLLTIVFCIIYCIVACILVYRIAPRTFKLRN